MSLHARRRLARRMAAPSRETSAGPPTARPAMAIAPTLDWGSRREREQMQQSRNTHACCACILLELFSLRCKGRSERMTQLRPSVGLGQLIRAPSVECDARVRVAVWIERNVRLGQVKSRRWRRGNTPATQYELRG